MVTVPWIWIYGAAAGAAALLLAVWIGGRLGCRRRERLFLDQLREREERAGELELERRLLEERLREREEALGEGEERFRRLEEAYRHSEIRREVLQSRLEEEQSHQRRYRQELESLRESMRREFERLSSRSLEENARRFSTHSRKEVEELLSPLRRQVEEFRRRIDEVHTQESRSVAALMQELSGLKELNRHIGREALRLTRALQGENKRQGAWGEMVLHKVLEASGLRRDREYRVETVLEGAEEGRVRPDVIVDLPGERQIVIDAKTSLKAYEAWIHAEEPEEKERQIGEHLRSLRSHIELLSRKEYHRARGIESLELVLMFVPIEGALAAALEREPGLLDEAFARRILLVGPSTLLATLKTIERTWRHVRQHRDAATIAREAGEIYDTFVSFATHMEQLGRQLDRARGSYESAWRRLREGRGNLLGRMERLKELGAQSSRTLPSSLAREAVRAGEEYLSTPAEEPPRAEEPPTETITDKGVQ